MRCRLFFKHADLLFLGRGNLLRYCIMCREVSSILGNYYVYVITFETEVPVVPKFCGLIFGVSTIVFGLISGVTTIATGLAIISLSRSSSSSAGPKVTRSFLGPLSIETESLTRVFCRPYRNLRRSAPQLTRIVCAIVLRVCIWADICRFWHQI